MPQRQGVQHFRLMFFPLNNAVLPRRERVLHTGQTILLIEEHLYTGGVFDLPAQKCFRLKSVFMPQL